MKLKDFEYTNSEMENIIDEHIHSQRDRLILKLVFIDGMTHEKVSEHPEVNLTPRQVSNIVSKGSMIIVKFLNQKGNENADNRPRLYGAISSQLG